MNREPMGPTGSTAPRSGIALAPVDTNSSARFSDVSVQKRKFPVYIAINEYSKRMEDELDMKPGDKIQVITDDEEYNDGWFYGRNLRTDEEGLYPRVFTQEISTPSLMRAKSSKRVASPLGSAASGASGTPGTAGTGPGGLRIDSSTNVSEMSKDGSFSELPTPQPLETAAPVNLLSGRKSHIERNISVKTTLSDIDRALEEFKGESMLDVSQQNSADFTVANTTTTMTESELSRGASHVPNSMSTHSLTNDTSFGISHINGVDTRELDIANALGWSPEQVTAYFICSGFDVESSSRFQQHKISGAILLELELNHLKELEINSFGTRFEIFKEIEAIKELLFSKKTTKRSNQLMPAAAVNQRSYMGHMRKTSQSLDELPSKSTPPASKDSVLSTGTTAGSRARPLSLALNSNAETSSDSNDQVFLSPRKPPKPPAYPSPVQPPKSPMANNFTPSPSTSNFAQSYKNHPPTIYERVARYDKSSASPEGLQTPRYQFPKTSPPQPLSASTAGHGSSAERDPAISRSPANITGNRSSVVYSEQSGHRKNRSGGSFVDLFQRVSMLSPPNDDTFKPTDNGFVFENRSQRPSSSVYEHSRTASPHHIRQPSQVSNSDVKKHRRNSSILSFFSGKQDEMARPSSPNKKGHSQQGSYSHSRKGSAHSPSKRHSVIAAATAMKASVPIAESPEADGKRRSVSAKEPGTVERATEGDVFVDAKEEVLEDTNAKRSVSEATKSKASRTIKPTARKHNTSAFMEGIRTISVKDAMIESNCSGWMSKKGSGAMGVWKNRFFTLHGTRLSYFSNTTDTRERGLIDITAHRVLPAKDDDKFVALYAASTGKGRYCFKLLPPQPGSKKGLTFTQPRVHYFAVDTKDEMRAWMAALIKATIDIDTSVPIISSCATPTVSLTKAQELLTQAREETRMREEQRFLNEEDEDQLLWEQQQRGDFGAHENNTDTSTPGSSIQHNTSGGFQSPYLLASGVLSPNLGKGNGRMPDQSPGDYFGVDTKYLDHRI
ncbi:LAMI_0D05006g1_1 [Lachancea mirantina]|uniref:LAMI_0D05006g1_1 n=1 Tax=Lachancea mirantina TaxID=1230905 RepID=A0A1G4JAV6_9SACH|nr:LAMI_0D05006g1_1 [Lachancea mirantina]